MSLKNLLLSLLGSTTEKTEIELAKRTSKKNKNKSNVNLEQEKPNGPSHVVRVKRATVLEWPDLWAEVFIAADHPGEYKLIAEMFAAYGRCRKADSPEEADLVVFGGGADVNPALYGQDRHAATLYDSHRDEADIALWNKCIELGIPMFGICRGAQFGHVMMGGELYQDVDNHNGEHGMYCHEESRVLHKVSSVHHQMARSNKLNGMQILGTSNGVSTRRYTSPTVLENYKSNDIEAFFYRDSCFFGVQGHPEYRDYHQFRAWTLEKIRQLLVESPDLHLKDGKRRLKEEIMAKRKLPSRANSKENA